MEQEWVVLQRSLKGDLWSQFGWELDPHRGGKALQRNWRRWRDIREDAPFASGNGKAIRLVLRAAGKKGILPGSLVIRLRLFFRYLEQIGAASADVDPEQRFKLLEQADGIIFDLTQVDFGAQEGRLIDLTTGLEWDRWSARKQVIESPRDRRARTLWTAFVALHSIKRLERTFRRSFVLRERNPEREDIKLDKEGWIRREPAPDHAAVKLAVGALAAEGEGLIERLKVLMQATYTGASKGNSGNARQHTLKNAEVILARMRDKVRRL